MPTTKASNVTKSHEGTAYIDWSHVLDPGLALFVVARASVPAEGHGEQNYLRYHRATATARSTRNAIIAIGPFGLYSALLRQSPRKRRTYIASSTVSLTLLDSNVIVSGIHGECKESQLEFDSSEEDT
jgi:hypothetical protein